MILTVGDWDPTDLTGIGCTVSSGALSVTSGDDLSGAGAITADSFTATTSGGATVDLDGAINGIEFYLKRARSKLDCLSGTIYFLAKKIYRLLK